ncbi:MBL fold metallo-hydrolase [Shewanella sp. 1_MG-2023]|uniref:MBL fold metallo-hydrolase n=1 Tax=unclassified Shewanella TaxID=196818 RepID=UPI0026E17785|nr:MULTISPECIES: MBL fold metallo-hydrolase [unclassified Shewanella]MDO6610821.1 MBL fold metallo-hydrolase [Shewanella sp. 7_MG-2023]MDO6770328.1 MBL fold metallo-hydrolase [Shewanella sp. 2_MG-2023]MDO6793469.1 MBL fold metallo-hydrolase [Shewanella sp. 1_MG-2023]
MTRTSLSCLLALSITSFSTLADDDRFKDVTITSQKLTENAYMFTGSGGNIGVSAGTDGILIIDDQFAPLADKISATLNEIQAGKPKYVINTHYHGDHTGGNAHFGEQGIIFAHHNVLKRLSAKEGTPKAALPVVTYSKDVSIRFNNDTLTLKHMGPGHTDGDSVVFWENDNLVHMGDLFFKDRFPYVDLNGGGSVIGYRDNVAKALTMMDKQTQVIPGHGELANKNDLMKFKHMLDDSINWMKKKLTQGKTLEQIQAEGVPAKWKDWSWNFITEEKWINTLYQDLKK